MIAGNAINLKTGLKFIAFDKYSARETDLFIPLHASR